jgi:hypothetical protein
VDLDQFTAPIQLHRVRVDAGIQLATNQLTGTL